VEVVAGLDGSQLEAFFDQIDTDMSGTISFNEWVSALVQMRKNMHQEEKEEAAVMDEAINAAVDAFDDAADAFAMGGELTFDDFWEAMGDDIVCQKIASATHIPPEFFQGLDKDQVWGFFQQIDTDMSGTVSFDEWVQAMVQMRQATYQEEKEDAAILQEAEAAAANAFDAADFGMDGELTFHAFITAMRDEDVIQRISGATHVPVDVLRKLTKEEIQGFFASVDTDMSGTIDFSEWMQALVAMRETTLAEEKEMTAAAAAEEEADLQDAVAKVAAAFADSSLTPDGELTMAEFLKCLGEDKIVSKVAEATKMPKSALLGLTEFQLASLFHHIDTDQSGSVSFQEWVVALINIRDAQKENLRAEQEAHADEGAAFAEWAFDGDDGMLTQELKYDEFLDKFKNDQNFLMKVAMATLIDYHELKSLNVMELSELFVALDTDCSGTIDFDEFVNGIVQIRINNVETEKQKAEDMEAKRLLEEKRAAEEAERNAEADRAYAASLPKLQPGEQQRIQEAYLAAEDEPGAGLLPAKLPPLLKALQLSVTDEAVKEYVSAANPRGAPEVFELKQVTIVYRTALAKQPLKRSARLVPLSTLTLAARRQEGLLRSAFEEAEDPKAGVGVAKMADVLTNLGLPDPDAMGHTLFLNQYAKERGTSGPVKFDEAVAVCNAALHRGPTVGRKKSAIPALPAISKSLSQPGLKDYAPNSLGKSLPKSQDYKGSSQLTASQQLSGSQTLTLGKSSSSTTMRLGAYGFTRPQIKGA